jgi:SAM-dependent methyltransferase
MDYDSTDIPVVYDCGRDHGPEMLQLWMNFIASCVGTQRLNTILDLGCGTGRFSEALAAFFNAEVVGVDPSKKMLEQAQRKLRDRRVRYLHGCGEAIPLLNDSVDLIFMSMCFHHSLGEAAICGCGTGKRKYFNKVRGKNASHYRSTHFTRTNGMSRIREVPTCI